MQTPHRKLFPCRGGLGRLFIGYLDRGSSFPYPKPTPSKIHFFSLSTKNWLRDSKKVISSGDTTMAKDVRVIKEARVRRVKVTHLEFTTYRQQPEQFRDYVPEERRVRHRVAVQIGRKRRGQDWENETLWLTTHEFAMLEDAIAEFREEDSGAKKPRPSPAPGKRKLTDAESELIDAYSKRVSEGANGEGEDEESSLSSDLNDILSDDSDKSVIVDVINGGDAK